MIASGVTTLKRWAWISKYSVKSLLFTVILPLPSASLQVALELFLEPLPMAYTIPCLSVPLSLCSFRIAYFDWFPRWRFGRSFLKKSKKFWMSLDYKVDRQVYTFLIELSGEVLVEAKDVLDVVSEERLVVDFGVKREFFLFFFRCV